MAERERSHARPSGAVFVPTAEIASSEVVKRALLRMAHEVVERHSDLSDLVVIGLQTGGVPLGRTISEHLFAISGIDVPLCTLDVAFYRDDIGLRPVLPEAATDISLDLDQRVVLLVDDVLFTGRTIRAALGALGDFGRARAIELAVLVDRGHRELPIRPDYIGKNLPTSRAEMVDASLDGIFLGRLEPR